MYGQQTIEGQPIKKPTGFMGNCPALMKLLQKRCQGRHGMCSRHGGGQHQPCLGKIAQRAAIYHDKLCETVLRGLAQQLAQDRRIRPGEHGINIAMHEGNDYVEQAHTAEAMGETSGNEDGALDDRSVSGEVAPTADEPVSAKHGSTIYFDFGILKVRHRNYTDDLTGQELPPELVHLGQQKELADLESKQVWELVPVAECWR